jgi:hypothetical protein
MSDILEGIVEDLRATAPFHGLPVTNRPHSALWAAYNRTLLALRMPLYHQRLGKPRPKSKAYDDAIQMGLAILASFAHQSGTHRAIVRINHGAGEAISFQPRPWAANWTALHALQPDALLDPNQDPMTEHGLRPQVSTADVLHLSRLVALAFIKAGDEPPLEVRGTATFEFLVNDWSQPTARIIYRPFGNPHLPAHIDVLRHSA